LVKAKLRAAEENAMNHQEIAQKAQAQVSTLVFNLDKAEVGLKQKECEVQALQQQVTVMSQSMEQMKATIQQNEGKLADFKQWLHETKQQFDEAKWREKSLTKDVAAAVQREQDMQQRVREMDARIVELEHTNFSLSSTAETRRAQLQKANADTARLEEDAKKLQLQLKDADKKHVAAKEEYELSLKAKTNDFFAAFGAIEQIHTGVCQPHVGIAHGIGISLEESQREVPRGDWETSKVHETCCKVESIIKHGVAENEGTLRAGDVIQVVA
jgi:chromosome segregation ATPase